jgi:hypothetical protein
LMKVFNNSTIKFSQNQIMKFVFWQVFIFGYSFSGNL